MKIFISFVLLLFALILQVAIFSDIHVLQGSADIVLLFYIAWVSSKKTDNNFLLALIAGFLISFISFIPYWVIIPSYVGIYLLNRQILFRYFDISILRPVVAILISTLGYLSISYVYLWVTGSSISVADAFGMVIVPSMLMNVMFYIPVYAIIKEVIGILYLEEEEA